MKYRLRFFVWAAICSGWCAGELLHADVPVQIGQNFTGSTFGSASSASPADGNGAVGPNHFVEFINGRFSAYSKTNGQRVHTMTDTQFWAAAGVTLGSGLSVSDPRLIFDTNSQRWFASMIDVNNNSRGIKSNHFLIAVSETADPTGAWMGVSFAADPKSLYFADFPTLGIDATNVYISGDFFDRLSNPIGPTLVSLPKSGLLANPPDISGRTAFGTLSYSARGNILQPGITTGKTTTAEMIVAVGNLGTDFKPHSTLILSTILNEATSAPTLANAVTLTVPSYSVPIDPVQPDGSNTLADGDARFSASARRVGDVLYAVHNVEVNSRAAVRWYRINATNSTLLEAGTIADTHLDLFYPSIAANDAGTVVIGCNGSSTNVFVSSYAAVGQVVNGVLTFGNLTLLKSGSASYQNPDGSGESRWGDYSATSVDPVDPNRFWTIQMIAATRSAWATQITELITTPSPGPSLTVTGSGQSLTLSWPASVVGYQLEFSPALGGLAQWTAVTQSPSVNNGINSVVVLSSDSQAFYRLNSAGAPP